MTYTVNTINLPEGSVDYVTVVLREVNPMFKIDRVFPSNVVIGASFKPDWYSASQELTDFDDTVSEWCTSIDTMANELEEYGYYLMEEDEGDIITEQVIAYLDK